MSNETKTNNIISTTKCATCNKPVREEAAMKTAAGEYYHATCAAPKTAAKVPAPKAGSTTGILDGPKKPAPKASTKDAPASKAPTKAADAPKGSKFAKRPEPKPEPKPTKGESNRFEATDDRNPYAAGVIAQSWEACLKGTTVKAISAACEKAGIGAGRVLRHMKSGEWKGVKWSVAFDKDKGTIKITPKTKTPKVA